MRKNKKVHEIKKYKKIMKKSILLVLIFLTFTVIGGVAYGYSLLSGIKSNNLSELVTIPKENEPINILVVGMDIGDTENLANKEARRTDSIMVVNYNPLSKKLQVVSIPRDTMIEVDAYGANREYQRYWKINSAYALGGARELITHVEGLLDIKINYTVEIDYEAFRGLIDSVDGVEMYIEQDMFYDDDEQNLHIKFDKGETVKLDGEKAEKFFRWRKNNDGTGFENGDIDRIKSQQKLIGKLIEKCLKPSIVFKLTNILDTITSKVNTNIPANKIIELGLNIVELKPEDTLMTSIKWEFKDIEGQSFVVSDKKENRELINSLTTSSVHKEAINKKDIKIMILNGTNKDGLASSVKTNLYDLGYGKIDTGNIAIREKSVIQIENNKDIEEILKSDTGIEKVERSTIDDYKSYDVVIIIGENKKDDFRIKQDIRG